MSLRMSHTERERLRAEFLEQARRDFERMFSDREQESLVTLDQRESRAIEIGQKLALWCLEHHLAGDDSPKSGPTAPCPTCGASVSKSTEPPETRSVQTRAGPVQFERARAYCAQCRRAFFPAGRPPRARHRRVQPKRSAQDRVRGR